MLCSLSSSCLSEICGGGWGIRKHVQITERTHVIVVLMESTKLRVEEVRASPRRPQLGHTTCECRDDWGLPPLRCGTPDRWPAFWTASLELDPLSQQWTNRTVAMEMMTALVFMWAEFSQKALFCLSMFNCIHIVKTDKKQKHFQQRWRQQPPTTYSKTTLSDKTFSFVRVCLTLEFVVFRVRGKGPVGE